MIRRRAHKATERLSIAAQMKRRAELDEIRLSRPLTAEERAEDDKLTHRVYMRLWRAQMADSGIRTEHRTRRDRG